VQPDSIIPGLDNKKVPTSPDAWNRFEYAKNNPIRYNDPTGHCIFGGIDTIICIVVLAAVSAVIEASPAIAEAAPQVAADAPAVENAVIGAAEELSPVAEQALSDITEALSPAVEKAGADLEEVFGGNGTSSNVANSLDNNVPNKITSLATYYPPKNGFEGEPELTNLQPGDIISRIGDETGHYASPAGTPLWARALPYGMENSPEHLYQVAKPIIGVQSGPVSAWFGQPGGGTQYLFSSSLESLLKDEYLIEPNN
jgi:hypothetical protein